MANPDDAGEKERPLPGAKIDGSLLTIAIHMGCSLVVRREILVLNGWGIVRTYEA
jgi:hypothetical protein